MKTDTKKLTLIGLLASVALILSFIETLLPPLYSFAPGVKIGLPNVIIMFALYRYSLKEAALVSAVRLILSALLFGSAVSFAYSLAGAALSLTVMWAVKKFGLFSTWSVSILGAVCHNLAQVAVAAVLMNTKELFLYLPVLAISGIITGIAVGLVSALLISKLKKI
ncbi:MAG: Gx transporter family protein [Clostridia bacterium]|nr:Gx transporter family protein [Clostridia bacterium]